MAAAPLEPVQAALVAAAGGPAALRLEPHGVAVARARATDAARRAPRGPEVATVEDLTVAGPGGPVPVRRYVPADQSPGRVVYLHSGGWVLGDLDTCDHIVRHLVKTTGLEYWSVDYRRAPEHPAPAALDDARAVLQHVAALGEPVVIHGDSAGGALAALLSQEEDDAVADRLRLAVLIYPVTDGDLTRPSYDERAEGGLLTASDMRWFWSLYAPGRDILDPELAPLRGAVARAAPTLIVVAGHDPLRDEGLAYADALQRADRLVGVHEFADCSHSFFNLQGDSQRAAECLGLVAAATRRAVTPHLT
jgi:acetyl esterase